MFQLFVPLGKGEKMNAQIKAQVVRLFNGPALKAVLFLTALLIAALAGGAPSDYAGG